MNDMEANKHKNQTPGRSCGAKTMPWVPRLWHGMTVSAWLRLLRENHFAVTPSRIPLALSVSAAAVANSALASVQRLCWQGRIDAMQLPPDPLFVIGHWRSGTTWLHELLTLDPHHAYPDTYACLAPSHFLLSRYLVPWWLGWLMPKRRPMDNVRVGWKQPQEDEWALCLAGTPSVYRTIAFPQRLPQCPDHLSLTQVTVGEQREWDRALLQFLRSVMLSQDRARLVLKSPTHTARIAHLLKLFPQARFVHVVRDPLKIFPSTLRLWTRLATDHGLQLPDQEALEQYVLDTFVQMYDAFESQRARIPASQICDVHYEQLVADPVGQLEAIYRQLGLGPFDRVRPLVERQIKATANFQTNQYTVTDQLRQRIQQRWSNYMRRYGYTSGSDRAVA